MAHLHLQTTLKTVGSAIKDTKDPVFYREQLRDLARSVSPNMRLSEDMQGQLINLLDLMAGVFSETPGYSFDPDKLAEIIKYPLYIFLEHVSLSIVKQLLCAKCQQMFGYPLLRTDALCQINSIRAKLGIASHGTEEKKVPSEFFNALIDAIL